MSGWTRCPPQGYAWGYIGSCVPFVASLGLILGADAIGISGTVAMMIAFFINAAWWVAVTLPLLRNYQQKYYVEAGGTNVRGIFFQTRQSLCGDPG